MSQTPDQKRALELLALGWTRAAIARQIGVSPNTISRWLDPDVARRNREASLRYKRSLVGICVDCGGPTRYAGTKESTKASRRCKWCAQGKLPPPAPDRRRCVPVRLVDIELEVRLEGAREANRYEAGDLERQEILFAAIAPSENVYWVSESARALELLRA